MKDKTAPLLILIAGSLWGTSGLFARHFQSAGLGSMEIGTIRVLTALLAVGLYLFLLHRDLLKIRLRDLWCFLGTGIFSLFLMNLTYFSAMEHISLAAAGVLLYTAPIFVMLMSALLFREQITKQKLLALVLAFCGCVLVSGLGTENRMSAAGLLLGLGAGISYALYSIFGRYAIQRGYGPWTTTFYSFLFCGVLSIFLCDWDIVIPVIAQPVHLAWTFALGLITAFAPYILYNRGLESVENSRASILASVEPVVGAVIGVVIFREHMHLTTACGIVLVLSAVILLSIRRKTQKS